MLRGSNSLGVFKHRGQRNVRTTHHVMSRDIGTSRTHAGVSFGLGLVVAVGVEGELAQELPGGWVDDADVEVVDDHEDFGVGVAAAHADTQRSA